MRWKRLAVAGGLTLATMSAAGYGMELKGRDLCNRVMTISNVADLQSTADYALSNWRMLPVRIKEPTGDYYQAVMMDRDQRAAQAALADLEDACTYHGWEASDG